MNVVYPYLRNYSRELEWSINSLKNYKDKEDVYVIGDKPDYEVDATFIRSIRKGWSGLSPYNDVLSKHKTATTLDISDQFVMMQDDIFLLDKWDGTLYNRGDLLKRVNSVKPGSYLAMIRNTYQWLKSNGYPTLDYTSHTPFVYDKNLLSALISDIEPLVTGGRPYSIRTLYGNVCDVESELLKVDTKNPKLYMTFSILSTNDTTFNGEIGEYIRGKLS